MIPARPLARAAARSARASPIRIPRQQNFRFQSTTSTASSTGTSSSHFGAGVAGGLAGAAALYGIYLITPAGRITRKINKGAKEAEKTYQAAAQKLQETTPDPDQAVEAIKHFAYSYVVWIPGGRAYVDKVFQDFETIRQNHRDEANQIINDAYKHFQEVAKAGLSVEALSRAYEALADLADKIAKLAGDSAADIINNHPQLKEKLGPHIDELKQLGDQYGPEAKKQVDKTWQQLKEVMAGGFSVATLDKARKLIQEKTEQVRQLGDEAWKKALEEAKPLLDKNPKVKELVEKNADALKNGSPKELFDKAKAAIESGDLGSLQDYVNSASQKVKEKGQQLGSGWDQYLKMLPMGEDIMPKLKQLSEVAEKHSEEGKALLEETAKDLKKLLEEKSNKAKSIAEKASKEAK